MGINAIHQCSNGDPMITIYMWYWFAHYQVKFLVRQPCHLPPGFPDSFPLLNSYLGCYKLRASSQDFLWPASRPVDSPAALSRQPWAMSVSRAISHGYTSDSFGLHSGSASLIRQGDYCATKPPTLCPTINRVWLTIVARYHTLQFTWYKFPYFTEIIGKNIACYFGSRISSKIPSRISASVSKISACCGPLGSKLIFQSTSS